MNIDHFMWGAPSLTAGIDRCRELLSAEAAFGGAHAGLGTHNALLSLGDVYLEIIAPDPEQSVHRGLAEGLRGLTDCGLVTWAAASRNLKSVAATLNAHGVKARGPVTTERNTPAGERLVWQLLFPVDAPPGMPFFIDWLDCPHPSASNPPGGQFRSLVVTTPQAGALSGLFSALDLQVEVQAGEPGLAVAIDTSGDTVTLVSTAATIDLTF